MWIVFGITAIVALVGFSIGKGGSSPTRQASITSGGAVAVAPSPVQVLTLCISEGRDFPPDLVYAAMRECERTGDGDTLAMLQRTFFPPQPSPATTQSAPPPIASYTSIVRGVTDGEWTEFVARLATEAPTFDDGGKHVGRYRHHTQRLIDLGIDPATLTSEAAQYQALETDFRDCLTRHAKLINEFAGDVIAINGQTTPVTRSGILALIKCAGAENARAWLSRDGERVSHPNTTLRFLAANGVF